MATLVEAGAQVDPRWGPPWALATAVSAADRLLQAGDGPPRTLFFGAEPAALAHAREAGSEVVSLGGDDGPRDWAEAALAVAARYRPGDRDAWRMAIAAALDARCGARLLTFAKRGEGFRGRCARPTEIRGPAYGAFDGAWVDVDVAWTAHAAPPGGCPRLDVAEPDAVMRAHAAEWLSESMREKRIAPEGLSGATGYTHVVERDAAGRRRILPVRSEDPTAALRPPRRRPRRS
ncbi:MAG TPA: hypothetical protein VEI02_06785 [Planctomycetota bacterium]|nr:hypothetical protein [Planctomycetota bacterium]